MDSLPLDSIYAYGILVNYIARDLAVLNSDDSVSHSGKSGVVSDYYHGHALLGAE